MHDTNYMQSRAATGSEMVAFLNQYQRMCINWKEYINFVLDTKNTPYSKISEKTGFSKNTIKKWCQQGTLPQNRDAFIKLAFSLCMGIEETDTLLTKYGGYSALYAKDIYDAIIIYVLQKHLESPDNSSYSFDSLKSWFEKYKRMAHTHSRNGNVCFSGVETVHFYEELKVIREEREFENFIELNQLVFFSTYKKLITFIDDFILMRIREQNHAYDERYSLHKLLAHRENGSRFEKMLSQLKNHGILPERKYLIAFGIALNMTLFELNKMLGLAKMRPLYARDKFDWIIISGVSQAMKADPDLAMNNAFRMERITQNSEWRKEFRRIGDLYLDDDFSELNDDMIEQLSCYMIQNLELYAEESEEVREIIQLLK